MNIKFYFPDLKSGCGTITNTLCIKEGELYAFNINFKYNKINILRGSFPDGTYGYYGVVCYKNKKYFSKNLSKNEAIIIDNFLKEISISVESFIKNIKSNKDKLMLIKSNLSECPYILTTHKRYKFQGYSDVYIHCLFDLYYNHTKKFNTENWLNFQSKIGKESYLKYGENGKEFYKISFNELLELKNVA